MDSNYPQKSKSEENMQEKRKQLQVLIKNQQFLSLTIIASNKVPEEKIQREIQREFHREKYRSLAQQSLLESLHDYDERLVKISTISRNDSISNINPPESIHETPQSIVSLPTKTLTPATGAENKPSTPLPAKHIKPTSTSKSSRDAIYPTNINKAECHQSLEHSWSCADITGPGAAFHPTNAGSGSTSGCSYSCGYCGQEFRGYPQPNWADLEYHLNAVHRFKGCKGKKYSRLGDFRRHLRSAHAGTNGEWMRILENTCMKDERHEPRRISGEPNVSDGGQDSGNVTSLNEAPGNIRDGLMDYDLQLENLHQINRRKLPEFREIDNTPGNTNIFKEIFGANQRPRQPLPDGQSQL